MGEAAAAPVFMDLALKKMYPSGAEHGKWVAMEGGEEVDSHVSTESTSIEYSSTEGSTNSGETSCSSDLVEDASSSSSSTLLSQANGPLYELSELMAQLPIKRGLSKFYQGKSQSYTNLARVESVEDLAKKIIPQRLKMKSCKSYGTFSPKPTISKKPSRGSFLSSSSKRDSLTGAFRLNSTAENGFQCA